MAANMQKCPLIVIDPSVGNVTTSAHSLEEKKLIDDESTTDCEFILGENEKQERVRCHKLVMARTSKLFNLMLYGPGSTDCVTLTEVDPNTFKAMKCLIYNCKIKLSLMTMLRVYELAETVQVDHIVSLLLTYIHINMNVDNVLVIYKFATVNDILELLQHCMRIIQNRTIEVIYSYEFSKISKNLLVNIMKQPILNLKTELHLFKAAIEWAYSNAYHLDKNQNIIPSKLIQILGDAVSHIRISEFTQQDIDYLTKITEEDPPLKQLFKSTFELLVQSPSKTIQYPIRKLPVIKTNIFKFDPECNNYTTFASNTYTLYSSVKFQPLCNVIITGVLVPLGISGTSATYKVKILNENNSIIAVDKTLNKTSTVFNFEQKIDQVKFKIPLYLYKGTSYRISVDFVGNVFKKIGFESIFLADQYGKENYIKCNNDKNLILGLSFYLG